MDALQAPGIVDALARIETITQMVRSAEPAQGAAATAPAGTTATDGSSFAGQLAAAAAQTAANPAAKGSFELGSGLTAYGTGAAGLGTTGMPYGTSPYAAPVAGAYGAPATTGAAPAGSPVTGAQLDAWMREKVPDSPLVGKGEVFVREGVANGIDPRFLAAVALNESALGTAGSGAGIHNAFGWGPAIPFSSWEENIATVAKGLKDGYVSEGRDTVAEIQSKWAPVGASNDPTNLNSNWLRGVTSSLTELGGDPNRITVDPSQAPSATALPYPWSVATPGTLGT